MTEKEKVEKSIIYLNNKYGWNLYSLDDQFSHWDAQSADMIVEFKFRNTHYQDKYLQVDKFYNLLMAADYYDKMLYYIVIDKEVTIFNLRTLKDELINSKVITQLTPYQTDFNKTKKVNKYFYILKHDQQTIL